MQRDQAHKTNKLLERIAIALEKNNKKENGARVLVDEIGTNNINEIPGFEGTKDALDNLTITKDVLDTVKTITDDYASKHNTLSDKCLAANCDGDECTHNDEDYDDDVHNDYLNDLVQGMNQIEFLNFHNEMSFSFASNDAQNMSDAIYELEYEECLGAIRKALLITGDDEYVEAVECSGFNKERKDELAREYVIDLIKEENTTDPIGDYANDPNLEVQMNQDEYLNANQGSVNQDDPYTYDNELREYLDGVINDSDHNIRKIAYSYDAAIDEDLHTKKDCILDYVTNEFGTFGARYTDVIKFAYYLGSPNAPKYTSANRGYYAMAFAPRYGGHLISAGKDYFVKGINKEGNERYFALSFVESATDYWKRIS